MTLIVLAASLLVVSVGLELASDISRVARTRERARLAADAAALAAMAESGPWGAGDHEAEASEYARLNGAELVECSCEPGATAVEVVVRVGAITARSRAVIEMARFAPATIAYSDEGLHPTLEAAVTDLLRAARGHVRLVSGWRDPMRQAALWQEAVERYGDAETADDWVARPGSSMHERGLAVDLGGDLDLAATLVDELDLPLWRPLAHEPWHFELAGSRR